MGVGISPAIQCFYFEFLWTSAIYIIAAGLLEQRKQILLYQNSWDQQKQWKSYMYWRTVFCVIIINSVGYHGERYLKMCVETDNCIPCF